MTTASAPSAIAAIGLRKSYGDKVVLDGIDLHVAGHDLARDPDAVRAAIGVTGQFSAVDKLLTGEENLILMADLHHVGRRAGRLRAAELLERFDLEECAPRYCPARSASPPTLRSWHRHTPPPARSGT